MAALGLSGCGADTIPPPPTATIGSIAPPPAEAALPAPEALSDVLSRLADSSVPGEQKVALLQYGTPGDAEPLDKFGRALTDNGLAPLTFQATDLAWAPNQPGDVVATITITPSGPQAKSFVYPMQFTRAGSGWLLTRATADQLLEMGQSAPPPSASQQPPR